MDRGGREGAGPVEASRLVVGALERIIWAGLASYSCPRLALFCSFGRNGLVLVLVLVRGVRWMRDVTHAFQLKDPINPPSLVLQLQHSGARRDVAVLHHARLLSEVAA